MSTHDGIIAGYYEKGMRKYLKCFFQGCLALEMSITVPYNCEVKALVLCMHCHCSLSLFSTAWDPFLITSMVVSL